MSSRKGGFEAFTLDDYTITPEGEVINNRWHRPVKPQPNTKGYLRVMMCGKKYFVHRLVAQLYVPNPDNKPQVNHKDGNKLNNRADNLEWVTNQENRHHAVKTGLQVSGEKCPWSKLTKSDVDYIRSHSDLPRKILSEKFHVNPSHISAIIYHKSWE